MDNDFKGDGLPNGIEGRLSTVEANYERLHEDVQGLSKKMDYGLNSIRDLIANSMEKRMEARKPQWGVIISAVGMVITILVLAFAPLIYGFQVHEDDLGGLQKEYIEHISDGHPESVDKGVTANAKDIEKLDEILQREMRLINDTTKNDILRAEQNVRGITEEKHTQQEIKIRILRDEIDRLRNELHKGD